MQKIYIPVQTQRSFQPDVLGEWSMIGPVKPNINDTICLTKNLLNKLDYPCWIFEEPNKIQIVKYLDNNSVQPVNIRIDNVLDLIAILNFSMSFNPIHDSFMF